MRRMFRALAILGLTVASVLILLAFAAWPPGGLMFALPYVFLVMAILVGGPSVVVLLVTRPRRQERDRG